MRSKKIDDDKYIVIWNEKYYVINSYTRDILEAFDKTQNIGELSKIFNLSARDVKKLYAYILEQMEDSEYCDNINLEFPLKIQWRITKKCNLKCRHCYLGDLDGLQLDKASLLSIADELANSPITEVTLTGGEALMVDCLPEITNKLVKSGIKINVYTNGLLLKRYLDEIAKFNLPKRYISLFVSIDGLRDTHDSIRGAGTFDKVIDNLLFAKQKGYYITTNTVLSNQNYKDVPTLFVQLYNMGINKIQISNIIEKGRASQMQLNDSEHKAFLSALTQVLSETNGIDSLLYADMPDDDCNSKVYLLSDSGKEYIQTESWKCSAGLGKATIDANGDVFCCPFINNSKIGNVTTTSLKNIWSNEERFKFLSLLSKNNNNSRVCLAVRGEEL